MYRPDYIAMQEALKYVELGMDTKQKSLELNTTHALIWKITKKVLNLAFWAFIAYLILT